MSLTGFTVNVSLVIFHWTNGGNTIKNQDIVHYPTIMILKLDGILDMSIAQTSIRWVSIANVGAKYVYVSKLYQLIGATARCRRIDEMIKAVSQMYGLTKMVWDVRHVILMFYWH